MKRKNLIARKKVKNNKHLFKDSKILNFYKKFKSIIYKDIKDKSFALAVSGGSDSMAALDFLNNSKRNVTAIYFNHRTRHGEEAKRFVRDYCMKKCIPLIDGKIRREKKKNESLEEYWRNERYRFFKSQSAPVITAHHLDDVVEWWIYSCLHGEGQLIPYENEKYGILRPFLGTTKSDLSEWNERHNVPFVEDPSNRSNDHMRNFIRNEMMSHILKVNPGITKVVKKKVIKVFETREKIVKSKETS